MGFAETLRSHFPDAVPEPTFVGSTFEVLLRHGFRPSNTIGCVSVCRDELTAPLTDLIHVTWGQAFNLSSLAGMIFLGRTGFAAALAHAPRDEAGREHLLFFALPHIAIDADGAVGRVLRPGRAEPSLACGALSAVLAEIEGGGLGLALDADDLEQSLLKRELHERLESGAAPDLLRLTRLTHDVIVEDLEHLIALMVDAETHDWAVLTGIQIHGPAGCGYVAPGRMYAVVEGRRHELSL